MRSSRPCANAVPARIWSTTRIADLSNLSLRYTDRLAEAGLDPSVGSVGDSYDNALAETIIGLFKAEVIHRLGPWKSAGAVEWKTLKWVDWFNHHRLLGSIGDIPPAEAERTFYEDAEHLNTVA